MPDPKKKKAPSRKVVKKPVKKAAPANKKKTISGGMDRFANYRNVPGAKPIKFAANGAGVTMRTKSGSTYTLSRGKKKK